MPFCFESAYKFLLVNSYITVKPPYQGQTSGNFFFTIGESLAAFRIYFIIVVDNFVPFTLVVVESHGCFWSLFVERFHCITKTY